MLAFYPLTPCRLYDTRGGNYIHAQQTRDFAIRNACGIPASAQAYSFNITALPLHGYLNYLTAWPTGQPQPGTSTLNAPTGTVTANAALVQGGTGGQVSVFAYNDTDVLIDTNGYFAPPGAPGQLALYTLPPCRVLDTRPQYFQGQMTVQVEGSPCMVPPAAQAYIVNATVLPQGFFDYLTLWGTGSKPVVSTLNAHDGAVTSNLAIVPANISDGTMQAFASQSTQLLIDIFSYMGLAPLNVTTNSLPGGTTGQLYQAQLAAGGGAPPYSWSVSSGNLPPGLTLSGTGVITGIPTSAGNFSFTVQVTDTQNNTATQQLSIMVTAGPLIITTTQLPNGTQGVAYSAMLGAAGGAPPYTWSIASGLLPAGLMLNTATGLISGTPSATGTSSFTAQVTDFMLQTVSAPLQIVINPALNSGSLNGLYAFSFNGFSNGSPFFMAGSFFADGNGTIVSGVLDLNNGEGSPPGGTAFSGTYSIGGNGLGTMSVNAGALGTLNFHLALSSQGNGQLILDNADPHPRGSGQFFVQTAVDFTVPAAGPYALGTVGTDATFARYAKAGAFQVASGGVTNGSEDVNDNGTLANRTFGGHFLVVSLQTGRGQASFTFPNGVTNNYAYYVVNRNHFLIVGTDPIFGRRSAHARHHPAASIRRFQQCVARGRQHRRDYRTRAEQRKPRRGRRRGARDLGW